MAEQTRFVTSGVICRGKQNNLIERTGHALRMCKKLEYCTTN